MRIIGIGKNNSNDVTPMVEGRVLPFVKDSDTYNVWEHWESQDRDLIFLDKEGYFYSKLNLSSEFPEDDIIEIIDHILDH